MIWLILMLGFRWLWFAHVSVATCALFWVTAITGAWLGPHPFSRWVRAVVLCGMLSNAVVTLANGGHMPVVQAGHTLDAIYVAAGPHSHLTPLCDRYDGPIVGGGWSIGDYVLLSGLIAHCCYALKRRRAERMTQQQALAARMPERYFPQTATIG